MYYSEGGFLDRQNSITEEPKITAFSPILPSRTIISYVDDDTTDSLTERSHQAPGSLYDLPNYETPVPQVIFFSYWNLLLCCYYYYYIAFDDLIFRLKKILCVLNLHQMSKEDLDSM